VTEPAGGTQERGVELPEQPVTIVGSYLSPYVRKVLAVLHRKGVGYEIDPIVPFFGNDEFARISPVRRVPVYLDESVTLSDSTVICEYLEELYPNPPLYPSTPAARARARWLEEFADTRMGEVFVWRLFNEVVIRRAVWGEQTDDDVVRNTLEVEIPQVLDYLEGELPADGRFLYGDLGIADIAIATFFRNAAFARFSIDAARWPISAAFVKQGLDHPSFATLRPFEELLLRTPIARHRQALADAGAPVATKTFGTASPRRGVLSV